MSHQRITVFDIEKDLVADKGLKAVRVGATRDDGEVLFDPDVWKGKGDELTINSCRLPEDELRTFAILATEVRQNLQAKVDAVAEDRKDDAMQGEEAKEKVPKLKRNYLPARKRQIRKELLLGHEHNTASANRRRLYLSQVSAKTRVQIVKMAAAKTRTHREIGELFNVRTLAVTQLSSAFKRSKSSIVKRRRQELKRSHE